MRSRISIKSASAAARRACGGQQQVTGALACRGGAKGTSPAGRAQRLHELSRFVRQDGRWYYLDGDLL